jgi:metal-dependent amidase/aminoacylase/carboxypeptidase family protein
LEGKSDSSVIEGGGGKIRLLDAGAYADHKVDISLMAHPGVTPDAALVRTAAYAGMKVEYFGKEAHAAARPWEGVRYTPNRSTTRHD